jgi:glutathione synthase/RimK-type ligase-like ATP-grasp enzyme
MKRKRTDRSAAASCAGVYREVEHSPGRVADDAAILEAVGRRLEEAEVPVQVAYRRPEEITGREADLPALAFAMTEGGPALEALQRWESRGVTIVNRPRAIAHTHRASMMPLLLERRIPVPESRLLDCEAPVGRGDADEGLFASCWIKQATGHKTREGDVVFASDGSSVREALRRLRERGQPRAVVQRHVEGDVVKFYGVSAPEDAPGREGAAAPFWFEWFHPKEHPVAGHAFDTEALRGFASGAARALGLDVWGGDAIVTPAGGIFLIDVNAWPSFALYREKAADHIAAHLAARLRRMTRVAV